MLKAVLHACHAAAPGNWLVQKGANTLLPSSLRMHMCTGKPWPEVKELIFHLCLMHVQAALLTSCSACNLVVIVRRSLKHVLKLVHVS